LKDLTGEDNNVEVLGTIVQVFDPRFFELCPTCNKRARPKDDKFACEVHGIVDPTYSYLINFFLDDGTENIRTVCFRDQAEKLANKNKEQMLEIKKNINEFDKIKTELLGEQVKIIGRVKKNEMFDRLELIANTVMLKPDTEEEIRRVEKELEQKDQ